MTTHFSVMLNKNEPHKTSKDSNTTKHLNESTPSETSKPLTMFLHEEDRIKELFKGLKIADCSRFSMPILEENSTNTAVSRDPLVVSEVMTCSHCNANFADRQQQVAHYKSDFHKYNVKRSADNQLALTEREFSKLTIDDDMLSLSGSESDDGQEPETATDPDEDSASASDSTPARLNRRTASEEKEHRKNQLKRHTKLFLVNASRQMFCIYKCLIMSKWVPAGDTQVELAVKRLSRDLRIGVFLLAGGHFAAAVFSGGKAVVHKTFHSYTVRAKQGGSQASRDSRSATTHCRSAGASLRRYNEASLTQHIQDLMVSWEPELARCSLLFVRALGTSAAALYGGKAPPLSRRDPRIRSVPFPTRRPTFAELERVYHALTIVHVYGTDVDVNLGEVPQSPPKPDSAVRTARRSPRTEPPGPAAAAAAAAAPADRRLTARDRRDSERQTKLAAAAGSSSESDSDGGPEYEVRQMRSLADLSSFSPEEGFDSARPLDDPVVTAVEAQRRRRQFRRQQREADRRAADGGPVTQESELSTDRRDTPDTGGRQTALEPDGAEEYRVQCYTLCKTGDSAALETLLAAALLPLHSTLAWPFGQSCQTLLHAAARAGHTSLVSQLLGRGADPTLRDAAGQTPYDVATAREVRNEFRRYRAAHPDRHNYAKAHIPAPLTEEMEAERKQRDAEKKKLQNQKRKEKMKERKAQQKIEDDARKEKEREEEEKERFLKLSDREKRAVAAERRLAGQPSGRPPVRCCQCARDITGRVPFEYGSYLFCSTGCVGRHRAAASRA